MASSDSGMRLYVSRGAGREGARGSVVEEQSPSNTLGPNHVW